MTALIKLRTLMLTLLAALGLTLGGMATATADADHSGGSVSDAPETVQWDDDEDDEWEDDDDDWGEWDDDDDDDEWEDDDDADW